eukprot:5087400-Amphidinium_carterae.1
MQKQQAPSHYMTRSEQLKHQSPRTAPDKACLSPAAVGSLTSCPGRGPNATMHGNTKTLMSKAPTSKQDLQPYVLADTKPEQ